MALFSNKEEVVLCSPMEGAITLDGEPLKGVKLERLIKWEDEVGEKDYVTTDDRGYFSFSLFHEIAKQGAFFLIRIKVYPHQVTVICVVGSEEQNVVACIIGW